MHIPFHSTPKPNAAHASQTVHQIITISLRYMTVVALVAARPCHLWASRAKIFRINQTNFGAYVCTSAFRSSPLGARTTKGNQKLSKLGGGTGVEVVGKGTRARDHIATSTLSSKGINNLIITISGNRCVCACACTCGLGAWPPSPVDSGWCRQMRKVN